MTYTFKTVLHLLFLHTLLQQSLAAREIRPRVVGGVEDMKKEFPFAVMLQESYPPMLRFCTGSIIAPTWILTAGHCISWNTVLTSRVKYGDMTIPSNETKSTVKILESIQHPGYRMTYGGVINDIGLLKTEKMINPTLVKLYAVDYKAFMGMPVKYAGFGRSKLLLKGQVHPETNLEMDIDPPLLVGEAVVISCKQDGGLSSGRPAICIAPRCGPRQHPYFGDSGGPLILNGRIIGVTNGFATLETVMGYGPVSPYLDWIYDTMRAD